jgi:hypothetical protein
MPGTSNILFLCLFVLLIGVLATSIVLNLKDKVLRRRATSRRLSQGSTGKIAGPRGVLLWAVNRPIAVVLTGLLFSALFLIMNRRVLAEKSTWLQMIFGLACVLLLAETYWLLIRRPKSSWLLLRGPKSSWGARFVLKRVVLFVLMIITFNSVFWLSFKYWPELRQARVESSAADEKAIRELVQASHLYEVRTIYADPTSFHPSQLGKYWIPSDQGGKEAERINAIVARLQSVDWHYGTESSPENFEILSVSLNEPTEGNAVVSTSERWFLPLYRRDGTRVLERNAYLGPFLVKYTLKKVNGTWLIQDSTAPFL